MGLSHNPLSQVTSLLTLGAKHNQRQEMFFCLQCKARYFWPFTIFPRTFSFYGYFALRFPTIFQCHIFLPFHTVHGVLKARIPKWFAIPFFSGPHFVRTLHHDPSILGGPAWYGLAYSFIELCKPVVHVFSLASSVIVVFILSAL